MQRKPLEFPRKSRRLLGCLLLYLPFVERTFGISDGFARKDSHSIGRRALRGTRLRNLPPLRFNLRASSAASAEVGGNCSRQANGRRASTIALEGRSSLKRLYPSLGLFAASCRIAIMRSTTMLTDVPGGNSIFCSSSLTQYPSGCMR